MAPRHPATAALERSADGGLPTAGCGNTWREAAWLMPRLRPEPQLSLLMSAKPRGWALQERQASKQTPAQGFTRESRHGAEPALQLCSLPTKFSRGMALPRSGRAGHQPQPQSLHDLPQVSPPRGGELRPSAHRPAAPRPVGPRCTSNHRCQRWTDDMTRERGWAPEAG